MLVQYCNIIFATKLKLNLKRFQHLFSFIKKSSKSTAFIIGAAKNCNDLCFCMMLAVSKKC